MSIRYVYGKIQNDMWMFSFFTERCEWCVNELIMLIEKNKNSC